jgi:hypothetical protein
MSYQPAKLNKVHGFSIAYLLSEPTKPSAEVVAGIFKVRGPLPIPLAHVLQG